MSFADIERRLAQLDEQFQQLLTEAIDAEDKEACNAQFAEILAEQTSLKKQKETIIAQAATIATLQADLKDFKASFKHDKGDEKPKQNTNKFKTV